MEKYGNMEGNISSGKFFKEKNSVNKIFIGISILNSHNA